MLFFPFQLQYAYLKPVYATIAIGLLMVAVFILQLAGVVDAERWGLMDGRGQPERVVAHAFIHGGFYHLAVNLCVFFVFGQVVNAALGWPLFLLVCTICGGLSAVAELALDARLSYVPAAGMSGVIAGLMVIGALWIPRVRVQFLLWFIFMFGFVSFPIWSVAATWVVMDLFSVFFTDWRGERVAYWGHLGGFAAGLVCWALLRRFKVAELRGFVALPERSRTRLRFLRKTRSRGTEGAAAPPELTPICLRCGFRMLLREPPGEKGIRCMKCGQHSKEVRQGDLAPPGARRMCLAALGVASAALFAVAWLLMRA